MTGAIKPLFSMRRTLTDPKLLGGVMPGDSWLPHRTLAIASQGEELTSEEREVFRKFTGRTREPGQRVKEFCTVAGRRAGKTVLDGGLATYLSSCVDYSPVLRPGEKGVCLCLAQTQQVARQLLDFVEENLTGSEILKQRFVRRTSEMIELTDGVTIEVRPASGRKLRGPTFIGLICDELAHWQVEEYLQDPDVAILGAARPGMLTMRAHGWGQVIMASSPFIRRGVLWDTYNDHYGKDEPGFLVARGSTRDFNPLVPQAEIDRELARDYETNKAEYLGEWRDDLEQFVRREPVEADICKGVYERPWVAGTSYYAFMDPATGSGSDSWTLCIGHVKNGNIIVIDLLREWRPPFKAHEVVEQITRLCKAYCITKITSDRTGKWTESQFTHFGGLTIDPAAKFKHDLYLNLLPYVNSLRIELLDHPRSVMQLLSLQRSRTKIDAPPGHNDDLVNAIAGVADIAIGKYGGYDHSMKYVDGVPLSRKTRADARAEASRRYWNPWNEERRGWPW
jgi:hypothetical protein